MAKELTVQQTRAVDLRSYLQSGHVKETLTQALPKWLSADRLLRIVFSSALRNPKLLECSQESILQSVMMCAQLGLEPILGRAYLIPYNNRKNINGRWMTVPECQMQVGYQGLIDLARRSGSIADVWGAVVYENDDFNLDYGMDRGLRHKPWFMDADKRKANAPGDPIGAYVVWQLKDGTKHPDFMPIHEIYKRRDKSQSYTWAETGDPNKGGGKRDSVWHVWPEEMILKTVIKHSAKMVPSSIEFMQAIEMDTDAESGRMISNPFSYDVGALQLDDGGQVLSESDLTAAFDAQANPDANMNAWLEAIGKRGNMTLAQVKAEIIRDNDIDNCMANYKKHMEKANGSKPVDSSPGSVVDAEFVDEQKPEVNQWAEEAWKNLRGPGVKSLAEEHRDTLAGQPKAIRDAFKAKWGRCKELESLMFPFNDAGQWIGYIKPDFTARNDPGERPTQAPGPASSESSGRPAGPEDMALVERYNELLPRLDKDGRLFSAKAAGCEKTVNGFARPTMEIMPKWVEAAETYLNSAPSIGDVADTSNDGEDAPPGFMDDEVF